MFAEAELQKWWDGLSADQQARLKRGAEEHDSAAIKLLIETRCPVGPVGTKWETEPNINWSWPESVREFLANK